MPQHLQACNPPVLQVPAYVVPAKLHVLLQKQPCCVFTCRCRVKRGPQAALRLCTPKRVGVPLDWPGLLPFQIHAEICTSGPLQRAATHLAVVIVDRVNQAVGARGAGAAGRVHDAPRALGVCGRVEVQWKKGSWASAVSEHRCATHQARCFAISPLIQTALLSTPLLRPWHPAVWPTVVDVVACSVVHGAGVVSVVLCAAAAGQGPGLGAVVPVHARRPGALRAAVGLKDAPRAPGGLGNGSTASEVGTLGYDGVG